MKVIKEKTLFESIQDLLERITPEQQADSDTLRKLADRAHQHWESDGEFKMSDAEKELLNKYGLKYFSKHSTRSSGNYIAPDIYPANIDQVINDENEVVTRGVGSKYRLGNSPERYALSRINRAQQRKLANKDQYKRWGDPRTPNRQNLTDIAQKRLERDLASTSNTHHNYYRHSDDEAELQQKVKDAISDRSSKINQGKLDKERARLRNERRNGSVNYQKKLRQEDEINSTKNVTSYKDSKYGIRYQQDIIKDTQQYKDEETARYNDRMKGYDNDIQLANDRIKINQANIDRLLKRKPQTESKELSLSDVEDKAKEIVNPVMADAIRDQKAAEELKNKATEITKDGTPKIELKESYKMTLNEDWFDDYSDEKLLPDDFDTIYSEIPSDPAIENVFEHADYDNFYEFSDLIYEFYPTAEFVYFDWKESAQAKAKYEAAIKAGKKVFLEPTSEGNDGYGLIIVNAKEWEQNARNHGEL